LDRSKYDNYGDYHSPPRHEPKPVPRTRFWLAVSPVFHNVLSVPPP
jgi:hypothetical protein